MKWVYFVLGAISFGLLMGSAAHDPITAMIGGAAFGVIWVRASEKLAK